MSRNQEKGIQEYAEGSWLGRELLGLVAIFFGLLLLLSLATFDARDPWLNQVISGKITTVHNKAGLFGSYTGGMLFDAFGIAAWMVPFYFFFMGARRILGSQGWPWWRWVGVVLLGLCFAIAGAARDAQMLQAATAGSSVSNHGGGLLGYMLYTGLVGWLSPTGTMLVWLFSLLLSVQMLVGFSWLGVVVGFAKGVWLTCTTLAGDMADSLNQRQDPLALPNTASPSSEQGPREEAAQDYESVDQATPGQPTASEQFSYAANGAPLAVPTATAPAGAKRWSLMSLFAKLGARKEGRQHSNDLPLLEIAVDEPEGTPPWLRDFESGRHGVHAEESMPHAHFVEEQAWQASPHVLPNATTTQEAPAFTAEELTTAMQQAVPAMPASPEATAARQPVPLAPKVQTTEADAASKHMEAPAAPQLAAPEAKDTPPSRLSSIFTRKAKIPLPGAELLEGIDTQRPLANKAMLEQKGKTLMTCLKDFGIQGELVGITPGPVVTMFEVRPAPGVRVSRIANLSDDLALALKSIAVRVQAPIPGTDTVGIEIPNDVRETVCFKELISSRLFQQTTMRLPLALGKDISGASYVADLAAMPHLLVAGATGAGKSVGINSILLSLLYKARPEEVKLLLVDPKRVEMAIYADLPHLVHPVVTEMSLAKNALDWAVSEMDKRYTDLARAGVRNIADYNTKLAGLKGNMPDELIGLAPMPYLVLVIDELADLMLVGSKEVETSIVRLAQLARAAGIHLILATQRPSVDVVTGLIKANFPCRIAFQVTSKHDSRTILDAVGAEYLLGKGDMLFKPSGGKFLRLHGAFVSDKNVNTVCDYWRARQKPEYHVDFTEWGGDDPFEGGGSGNGGDDVSGDPLYGESCEFVRQQGKVSISLIQRRFRIGFNKAARFVDQMEHDGIVTPADGSRPRQVIR
ncbi:DNA translocase FtsK [Desulfovibrio cuneatus]|uniref:DNA translocase FtsK n=1 Tax=Desulfovibrio cuneatus TaxID=159728 RepID=UPI000484516C|nr:DNA translocase FtsK [Desulfovibrio cuneatus]